MATRRRKATDDGTSPSAAPPNATAVAAAEVVTITPAAPVKAAAKRANGRARTAAMATQRRPGVKVFTPYTPVERTPIKGQPEGWQEEAYAVVDQVAIVGYLVNVKANTLALGQLRAEEARAADDGTTEWVETTNPDVVAQLAELRCEIGGQAELLRRMAQHVEIAGRFYLAAVPEVDWAGEPTGARYWEPYSVLELTIDADRRTNPRAADSGQGSGRVRRTDGGNSRTTAAVPPLDGAIILDCIRRAPRSGDEADSPLKRLLPACRQLVWLNMAISAVARQRAHGGLVGWPVEIDPEGNDGDVLGLEDDETGEVLDDDLAELAASALPDSDTGDQASAAMRKLWAHVNKAIEDPESPAAASPLIVAGAAEFLKAIVKIDIAGSFEHLGELRAEVRREIAEGYDAPPEKVTGVGGVAGWGAYSIDMDWNTRHVAPLGQFLAEWLTARLLRPALVAEHGMDWTTATRFRLVYDGSALVQKPDMTANAKLALDASAISLDAFRRALGFQDADAPTDEERLQLLAANLVRAAPIGAGPALASFLGFPPEVAQAFLDIAAAKSPAVANTSSGVDVTPGGNAPPQADTVAPHPTGPQARPGVPDGTEVSRNPGAQQAQLLIAGMAYQAGRRCAEVIGSRLRSKLDRLADGAAVRRSLVGPPQGWWAQLTDQQRATLGMADVVTEIASTLEALTELGDACLAFEVDPAPFHDIASAVAVSILRGMPLDHRRSLAAVASAAGAPLALAGA